LDLLEDLNHAILEGIETMAIHSGTKPKPTSSNVEKLEKWEEFDAQALSMILMNIVLNVQAGVDCSSAKAAWDGLLSR